MTENSSGSSSNTNFDKWLRVRPSPRLRPYSNIRTHSCKDIITYLNKRMNYRCESVTLYEFDAQSSLSLSHLRFFGVVHFIVVHRLVVVFFLSRANALNLNTQHRHTYTTKAALRLDTIPAIYNPYLNRYFMTIKLKLNKNENCCACYSQHTYTQSEIVGLQKWEKHGKIACLKWKPLTEQTKLGCSTRKKNRHTLAVVVITVYIICYFC